MSRSPVFALIDCNNFFVSCERVFRPDLKDKPVAVLSNNDAVIVARSNEVKALGITMASPYHETKDLLKRHSVTLFSANFGLYGDFSQRVVQILQQFCPVIEVYSVDESFVEISKLPVEDYEKWALELREAVLKWTGIPVSIGVAPTKTLAKAAAEFAKQDKTGPGVHIVKTAGLESFLRWLPVGSIWGIGWRTAPKLKQMGISTAFDLSKVSDKWVLKNLTIRGLKTVKELRGESCIGLDESGEPQKSISRTRSFGHNIRNYYQLEGAISNFAAQTAVKLRQQGEVAGGVIVFLQTGKHVQASRSASTLVTFDQASSDTGTIISGAIKGLSKIYDPEFGYRRGGVILAGLKELNAWQLSFNGDDPVKLDKQAELMRKVDQINKKYRTRLVRHASEQIGLKNWHSKRERRSPSYTTNWAELPIVKT